MKAITLTINGQEVKAEPGATVLEAARTADIYIPTLCYHPDLPPEGHCRMCLVEIEKERNLQPACTFPAAEGMVVHTHTKGVREARRLSLELILSNHPADCLNCIRSNNCELQKLAAEMGIEESRFEGDRTRAPVDDSSYIIRDNEKCVLCRRCLRVCQEVQGVSALGAAGRGWETAIGPAFHQLMEDAVCVNCGQCINYCPTGALREQDAIAPVWRALTDSEAFVVVQTAPAVRAAVGEEAGMPHGALATGQMVSALRLLGFDRVFDTQFTADLTIMEEGHELLKRINEGGKLPMFTSCCPGWIKFAEHFYPDLLDHISTCKSPQQMFGAVAKTYYAQQAQVDPSKMVVVSVMPCTAKKFEAQRPEMADSGFQDVDHVLTTREFARMLRQAGIDLSTLPEGEYDDPLGTSTGAAVIFGATGGVMEAALRTVYEVVTAKTLEQLDFEAARGLDGIREVTASLNGMTLRAAIANGLGNVRKIMERVRSGEADYHFIEMMACPGGCLAGGGQPIPIDHGVREKRASALYRADREMPLRKSHENPVVKQIYEEYFEEPLSHRGHELLHTHYESRSPAEASGAEVGRRAVAEPQRSA